MTDLKTVAPQQVAAALSAALQADTKGQGHHVTIAAVRELAETVRHDAAGRAALIAAAAGRFGTYRKITQRGGQSFDALALAATEEKILFHGLRTKLPMQQLIPAEDAGHYAKYGVGAFAQAFHGSGSHLAKLSPETLRAEVARQIETELPVVHQHLQSAGRGMGGQYPVLEQLGPLYSAVSVVQSLGQAVDHGVHEGVGNFMQRFGALGRPAVAHMAAHGRGTAPVLASFVREALNRHDTYAAAMAAPFLPGSATARPINSLTP